MGLWIAWRHHHAGCESCNRSLVMALGLTEIPERVADPAHVRICLDCGYLVALVYMFDEWQEMHVGSEGWGEPCTTILIVKRALEARAGSLMPGWGLGHP